MGVSTEPKKALFLAGMVKMGMGMGTGMGRVQSYPYPNPPHIPTRFVLKKFKQIYKLYYLYGLDLAFELK